MFRNPVYSHLRSPIFCCIQYITQVFTRALKQENGLEAVSLLPDALCPHIRFKGLTERTLGLTNEFI